MEFWDILDDLQLPAGVQRIYISLMKYTRICLLLFFNIEWIICIWLTSGGTSGPFCFDYK